MTVKNRPRFKATYWTLERVKNGLERFIRDIADGDPENLPANFNAYNEMVGKDELNKNLDKRLYPPAPAVLRHYEAFVHAWWDLGYLVEVRASSKKYELTPEIEARLREIYSYRFGAKERPKDLPGPKEYARQLGFPEFVTTKWAQELGLSFTKEPPWSEEELELLDEQGYKTPSVLARIFREHGFKRTPTGIGLMRKRRMSHKASPYFSMNAVSILFGVDAHVVKRWIEENKIKFELKGTKRDAKTKQNGDTHLIHKDWIYEFIVSYPDSFDIKKVDQMWFLHIVTKGEVPLTLSDPSLLGKRAECQQIEQPVEWRKSKLKEAEQND